MKAGTLLNVLVARFAWGFLTIISLAHRKQFRFSQTDQSFPKKSTYHPEKGSNGKLRIVLYSRQHTEY